MQLLRNFIICLLSLTILSFGTISCSSRTKGCMTNNTYKGHNYKKSKAGMRNPTDRQSRGVKKDYVIKNGIAR